MTNRLKIERKAVKTDLRLKNLLQIGFAVCFVASISSGQNVVRAKTVEPILTIVAIEQKDSPVRIQNITQRPYGPTTGIFEFELLNLTDKPIRAVSVITDTAKEKQSTSFFARLEFIEPGKVRPMRLPVAPGISIKAGDTVSLSIDFVEFADGLTWGIDTRGNARFFVGIRDGSRAAIKHLREMLQRPDRSEFLELMKQDLEGLKIDMPKTDEPPAWADGYRGGWLNTIAVLQRMKQQPNESLLKSLDEMTKIID